MRFEVKLSVLASCTKVPSDANVCEDHDCGLEVNFIHVI